MSGKTNLPSVAVVTSPKLTKQDIDKIAEKLGCSSSYVAKWYYDHTKINPTWRKKFADAMVEVIAEHRPILEEEVHRIDGAIAKLVSVKNGLLELIQSLPA